MTKPSEWAMERAREAFRCSDAEGWSEERVLLNVATALDTARAEGEAKGRGEMRDEIVADLRVRAAHAAVQELGAKDEGHKLGSSIVQVLCARLAEDYATLPTTPPRNEGSERE